MSFLDCIKNKKNLLTDGEIKKLADNFNDLVKRYSKTMGDVDAANAAALKITLVKREQLLKKKINTIKAATFQLNKTKELHAIAARNGVKINKPYNDLMQTAANRGEVLLRRSLTIMGDFVEKHRSKLAGLKVEREGLEDVYRVLAGENVIDQDARLLGESVREALDYIHNEYKISGGIIEKLKNYYPQLHDRKLLSKSSFEEWYNFIRPKLDIDRMIDSSTGLPFTDKSLLETSKEIFEAIVTNGRSRLSKRVKKGYKTKGVAREITNKNNTSRFYHFKSADDFFEYNNKYGSGDDGLYDMLINHLRSMSRDTGIIQVMGVAPNGFNKHMQLRMESTLGDVSVSGRKFSQGIYDVLTGSVDQSASDSVLFNSLANLQKLRVASVLGAATISALSDSTFVAMTAKMNGLPVTNTMKTYLSLVNPKSSTDRQLARNLGFIADDANATAISEAKFGSDVQANKAISALSSFTIRASGLNALTQAAKNAPSLELMSVLSTYSKVDWADLDKTFKEVASSFGINEKEWDIIRATKPYTPSEGVSFIKPSDIADKEVGLKVDDWIEELRNLASNEPALKTRAITTGAILGDARRGTLLRAISSSTFMFKGFGITVLFNHLIPAIRNASQGNVADLAYISLATMIMGGVSLQLKELVKGKETRDMSNYKFWQAAALQGGGFGLYGDFFFAEYDRFGRDPFVSMMGFAPQVASDISRAIKGNLERAAEGRDNNFLRDTLRITKGFIPAQSLWYSRLLTDRLFFDQLEKLVDPKYHKRRRQHERSIQRDYEQKYWWRKGEILPE